MLRCKMRVESVVQAKDSGGGTESETVSLLAVYGANGSENAQWAKWTPSASFKIQINNPAAFGKLARGHEFYVDFTPAELGGPVAAEVKEEAAPAERVV